MNVIINYEVVKSEQNFLFCEMWSWVLFLSGRDNGNLVFLLCFFPLLSTFLPQKTSGWRLFSAFLLSDELQVMDSSPLTVVVAPSPPLCAKKCPCGEKG